VPLTWTRCHFGGARPWFRYAGCLGSHGYNQRVAVLYLATGSRFACRRCLGLAYRSQSETQGDPRHQPGAKATCAARWRADCLRPAPREAAADAPADLRSAVRRGDKGSGACARSGDRRTPAALPRTIYRGERISYDAGRGRLAEADREVLHAACACSWERFAAGMSPDVVAGAPSCRLSVRWAGDGSRRPTGGDRG
jgi:hypothetical protein